jgi:pimeloyl-ACP methyl ester carboxylesterase
MHRLWIGPLVATLFVTGSLLSAQKPAASTIGSSLKGEGVTTDVVYGHKAGMALTFDVYRPRTPNGAAVISVLSGGWQSGWDSLRQFQEMPDGSFRLLTAEEIDKAEGILPSHSYRGLLDKGFTVIAVRHGSSPTFAMPEIVADLRRAVRFVRRQAPAYGVNPDRIGAWGGSAGGHLSLLLGTTAEIANAKATDEFERGPAPLAAVVAYAPPTDLVTQADFWKQGGAPRFPAVNMDVAELRLYSPLGYVSRDDPPTLIVHGDKDAVVPYVQGKSMYEALLKAGVPSRLVTVEGAGHGFFKEDAKRVNAEMVGWFEKYLLKK